VFGYIIRNKFLLFLRTLNPFFQKLGAYCFHCRDAEEAEAATCREGIAFGRAMA